MTDLELEIYFEYSTKNYRNIKNLLQIEISDF